jgi:hypothetical protein
MKMHQLAQLAALALGLALALPAAAAAPAGWIIAGSAPDNFEFALDPTTAPAGAKKSASITAKADAKTGDFGTLMQTFAADNYRGGRWRLSGYMRTEAANRAQMWMRVDDSKRKVIGFDNMDSRPVTGTTGWTRYEVVLDVPPQSATISFGFFLISSGKVWADKFSFEKVDAKVAVTTAGPALLNAPTNLNFDK